MYKINSEKLYILEIVTIVITSVLNSALQHSYDLKKCPPFPLRWWRTVSQRWWL